MSEIHRTAARGFDAGADAYERARPGYPSDCVDWLVAELRILEADAPVLDLAAGTGKFTRELVARGIDCVAVEPVEGMRARFAAALPDVQVLDGTAEAIPLDGASVSAIVVAQAFHWFRHGEALAEMHRVMLPGGRAGILWNVRDESEPWVGALTELMAPYERAEGVKVPRHREETWRAPLESSDLFERVAQRDFRHDHEMDVEGLVERIASVSFVAVLDDVERAHVLAAVRALASEHPDLAGRERFAFPYIAETYVFKRV